MAEMTIQELKRVLDDVVDRLDHLTQIPPNYIQAHSLDLITHNAGLISSGEFRSGNNKEPGKGFTGVRLGYPGFTYNGEEWQFAGVETDILHVGIKVSDGKLYAGVGAVVVDSEGIKLRRNMAGGFIRFEDGAGSYDTIFIVTNIADELTFENHRFPSSVNSSFRFLYLLDDDTTANMTLSHDDIDTNRGLLGLESATNGVALRIGGDWADVGIAIYGANDVVSGGKNYIRLGDKKAAPPSPQTNNVHLYSNGGVLTVEGNPGGLDMTDGHVRSHAAAVADDAVDSFTPSKTNGAILLTVPGDNSVWALIRYQTGGPVCAILTGSTNLEVTTGVLTGTTGTDTKFTVSAHTDGKLYFENRRGGSRTYSVILL